MGDADVFHRAARDGYLDKLKTGNRKQMNTPDEDGCTPAMLAAQCGNLEALRTIITRGGDVDKTDLLGSTPLHHAARNGHWNCVSFLINFGANIWKMDNDMHTALNVAVLENRTDIVKLLDMAQNEQENKNPKVVRQLKEKALKEAEKHIIVYEREQDKASKYMEKMKRQQERMDSQMNGDFKAPTKNSLVKMLTFGKKSDTAKLKAAKGSGAAFSDLAGTTKSKFKERVPVTGGYEFTVSEVDDTGKRTVKSVRGTASRLTGQVLYTKNINIDDNTLDEPNTDNSARPALTNVFPGASVNNDSGVESFECEETPGIFNRPMLGKISFLSRFDHFAGSKANNSEDDIDGDLENGWPTQNGYDADDSFSNRTSSGTDSLGRSAGEKFPDDLDPLDDDEDDSEYTPVIMFLEGCGLTHYAHLFLNGDVDMDALMMLTNQDFHDMGLPIGPRRKLMDAIQRRRVVLSEPAQMYDTQL